MTQLPTSWCHYKRVRGKRTTPRGELFFDRGAVPGYSSDDGARHLCDDSMEPECYRQVSRNPVKVAFP